jgi:hypothetical protein
MVSLGRAAGAVLAQGPFPAHQGAMPLQDGRRRQEQQAPVQAFAPQSAGG